MSNVADRYAKALMELSAEQNTTDPLATELAEMGQTISGSRDLRVFLGSPLVKADKKGAALHAVFSQASQVVERLIDLLVSKGREAELPAIVTAFGQLHDRARKIGRAEVTSAAPLSDAQRSRLKAELEGRSDGGTVELTYRVDPSLLGGLVIKQGDTVQDGSLRYQLEKLREQLITGGAPISN